MQRRLRDFTAIVVVDFEYSHHDGRVEPVCCCAKDVRSGREWRVWRDELAELKEPPYPHGRDALFVSYNATAELSCYLELGWPMPPHILDLLIEYRWWTNGKVPKHKPRNLLAACRYFGIEHGAEAEKEDWQQLIVAGGWFDAEQKAGILEYCWTDVAATIELLEKMAPRLPADLAWPLRRGRYTVAVADMERRGIPVDEPEWQDILANRETIQAGVAEWLNQSTYPLYETGNDGVHFRMEAFEKLLGELGLLKRWRLAERSGRLSTDDETLKKFSWNPAIARLRQARQVIQQLRKPGFEVVNGRNYYSILPFKAETSRNATVGCIFQSPSWLRGLIQPKPGWALIYADYAQEEFLIGGVLAGDDAVVRAYESGDPYVAYGIAAGLIPAGGTKETHPDERALAKTLLLATQYGMSAYGLATRLGVSRARAGALLATHREIFNKFWGWSDRTVRRARWERHLATTYAWRLAVSKATAENTLRNFEVQGTGAEILRRANLFLWEAGVRVCAPVHDAFLIECKSDVLEDVALETRRCLESASVDVLKGHRLRTELRILQCPERLLESRGQAMWDLVRAKKTRPLAA